MKTLLPRVVVVTRPTEYESLLATHGTVQQSAFFLESRNQSLDEVAAWHERFVGALEAVLQAVPRTWRRARIRRADLDRFLFEPEDVVVAVGQDGLVPNVAKYLRGQLVIGINPDPDRFPGVLVRHRADAAAELIWAAGNRNTRAVEERTLAEARLDDGQVLFALNEVFIGQRNHQSAKYRLTAGAVTERQSSSGIIVSTGTGATGWARSVNGQIRAPLQLPGPTAPQLAWFVREPWPSKATGTDLSCGLAEDATPLRVLSEMSDTGVVFGDGIEEDCLRFGFGQSLVVKPALHRMRLVVG